MAKNSYLEGEDFIPDRARDIVFMKMQRKMFKKHHRRCNYCGTRGSFHSFLMPLKRSRLRLYLTIDGVVGVQEVLCPHCDNIDFITSSENIEESEMDRSLRLTEYEMEYYSHRVEHHDIVHDLIELLHVAAISDLQKKLTRNNEMTELVMQKAKVICEEWCRPENIELRYHKYLVLYKETVVNCNMTSEYTPNVSEEYKEMYRMLNKSFHSNRINVEMLLCLMKETLFDSPSVASFMMWVKVAMLHTEQLNEFENIHSEICETLKAKSYVDLMDRFLSVDIPVGLKKIPVVFVLFELPRFYHFVEFCQKRSGFQGKKRSVLNDSDWKALKDIETRIKHLKENAPDDDDLFSLFASNDKFKHVLDDHLRRADELHLHSPNGITRRPGEIQTMARLQNHNPPPLDRNDPYVNSIMTTLNNHPTVELKKKTMTDTHAKVDDYEVCIQSTVMTHSINADDESRKRAEEEMNKSKPKDRFIDATKITEIDNETGLMKVYERIVFKYIDDQGTPQEALLVQSEPQRSRIVGYNKETFKLAELGKYCVVPVEKRKAIAPPPGEGQELVPKEDQVAKSIEELPLELQEIIVPLLDRVPSPDPYGAPTMMEVPPEIIDDDFESPRYTLQKYNEGKDGSSKGPKFLESVSQSVFLAPVTPEGLSKTGTRITQEIDQDSQLKSATQTRLAILPPPRKMLPQSKKPQFKYGAKWKKNKMTYDVDEVSDTDSDKEEEYTFYPCKLLSEYVESENIVETAPKDLAPGVSSLADFLERHDIHPSLWTIKKKYIHNELFVVLDVAKESDLSKLPLVSASNNKGVSVPVLPILNPTSDSSALDMTIGSLYGIQVSHKLSNKQRNVFQRYVRIAVARARHPDFFDNISLGAIKYVKSNDKCVEVKLSVKDMQYEARNEEESERRKIIRLLKRAGAEQGNQCVVQ